ncbi:MAG TPA: hypothetical protein VFB23_00950 [Candidatus Acidoferrales bacterium]|jgi:hypothetical protein|nr:hypothetical protein [Candidatus Acidoferrales bacterium]
MKTGLKVAGLVVICVVLLLVVLSITGLEPRQRTPGLWLKGNVVTTPVRDWSFTDHVDTVEVQTRSWYGLPHSVTTYCVAMDGKLYLDSFYPAGAEYPHGRSWNENVARDPHVRLKIAGNLYDVTLVHDTDPALKAAILELVRKKYPQLKVPPDERVQLFHVAS